MLSKEAFKQIGEAGSDEERLILCQLHDVSFEWFNRVWPAEKLGIDVLANRALIIKVEHHFEPIATCFDSEAEKPQHKHTLVIRYKRYDYESGLRVLSYVTTSPAVITIDVDADQVPPSLREAIDYEFKLRC